MTALAAQARHVRWALWLFLIAAFIVVGGPRPSGAQSADQRLDELVHELGEVSTAERAQLQAVLDAKSQREAAASRVKALDAQLIDATQDQLAAEQELGQASGRLLAIERGLRIAAEEIERSSGAATAAAQRLYVQHAVIDATPLALTVSLDDTNEALSAGHYLDVVQRQQRQVFLTRQQAQQELTLQRSRLEAESTAAAALRDRATARRLELATLRPQLEAARNDAVRAEVSESAALANIQAIKTRYERDIAVLRSESEAIAAQLGVAGAGTRPRALLRPAPGPITSTFGPRRHPIFGTVRNHDGIDIGAAAGTPIVSAAAGTVARAGVLSGYGNVIVVDHGGGLSTLYAHQSRFAVAAGQKVTAGQLIGYVGSTGFSTGPHLHFEVRVNGKPVDPMSYL